MFWQRTPKVAKELETLAAAHHSIGHFSGVVLVEQRRKLLLHKAYGMATLEHNLPLTTEQRFNIGSVSKVLTALAILQLETQGKLLVTSPLEDFLPDFPNARDISLHHLLSNTSGMPDYLVQEGKEGWYALPHSPEELLKRFQSEPLLFTPGKAFGYSNSNWVLLVLVVEQITGMPWAKALKILVLDPLDLKSTLAGKGATPIANKALGYRLEKGQKLHPLPIDASVEVGAGGIFSTAADLLKLEHALPNLTFYEKMSQPVAHYENIGYGYGLMSGEKFGRKWQGHSGGTFGYNSFLTHYPEEQVTVIVLSNLENGSAQRLEQDLAAILFKEPYALPAAQSFIQLPPAHLDRFLGHYQSEFMGRPVKFEIKRDGQNLSAHFPLLPKARLQALSETQFLGNLKGGEVSFNFHAQGVRLDWSGTIMECPRLEP